MFWCTRRCNSLGDPMKFEGKMSKYKLIRKHSCTLPPSPDQLNYPLFFNDLHSNTQIIESISPKALVREFISPVFYFFRTRRTKDITQYFFIILSTVGAFHDFKWWEPFELSPYHIYICQLTMWVCW